MKPPILIGSIAFRHDEALDALAMSDGGASYAAIARRLGGCTPSQVGELVRLLRRSHG
jgi:transposase-like protein